MPRALSAARLRGSIRPRLLLALLPLLAAAGCGDAPQADPPPVANQAAAAPEATPPPQPQPEPVPDRARVRIETERGAIIVELDGRRAPVTTANFLAYVDQHRFDGVYFYRAARTRNAEQPRLHPGRHPAQRPAHAAAHRARADQRDRPPPPRRRDLDGAARAGHARWAISSSPSARCRRWTPARDDPGFAAFGRVVEGMDVVRRILAAETVANAGRGAMKGQMIAAPVRIVSARRVE